RGLRLLLPLREEAGRGQAARRRGQAEPRGVLRVRGGLLGGCPAARSGGGAGRGGRRAAPPAAWGELPPAVRGLRRREQHLPRPGRVLGPGPAARAAPGRELT